ncbi:MAG TPA: hypothetical protein VNJ52_13180 [Patescibacteria group bacterium]|nr:hypothetical protein [Patescibacteria group bacterium]
MANVIIYLVATIGVGVQVYAAITSNLWWAPPDPFPMVGLIGALIMTLGTAWGAVKGSSAAWIVFVGSLFCWAFYIPGLGNLLGGLRQSLAEGRISLATVGSYLPLLPALLLAVATYTALMIGPMGKAQD